MTSLAGVILSGAKNLNPCRVLARKTQTYPLPIGQPSAFVTTIHGSSDSPAFPMTCQGSPRPAIAWQTLHVVALFQQMRGEGMARLVEVAGGGPGGRALEPGFRQAVGDEADDALWGPSGSR
jgi:hypothetical protein